MEKSVKADTGYVFLVKYSPLNEKTFYTFWCPEYMVLADRFRFVDARVERTEGDLLHPYAHNIQPPELDRKWYRIFAYMVKKPIWFDRIAATRPKPVDGDPDADLPAPKAVEEEGMPVQEEENPQLREQQTAKRDYEDMIFGLRM